MEIITIILIVVCAILIGAIVYLIVAKPGQITPEKKSRLVIEAKKIADYVVEAYSNDGKISSDEMVQILQYLAGVVAILVGVPTASAEKLIGADKIVNGHCALTAKKKLN